jgi:metal-sulfur cluster biosynthetic enzyme
MDKSVQEKFDAVLEQVKDPESELPIGDLGVVKKFRYSEEGSTIYVFTDYNSHRPACMTCVGISMAIENSVNRAIREELQKFFPEFKVEFVSA